jgi:hypothetical protein
MCSQCPSQHQKLPRQQTARQGLQSRTLLRRRPCFQGDGLQVFRRRPGAKDRPRLSIAVLTIAVLTIDALTAHPAYSRTVSTYQAGPAFFGGPALPGSPRPFPVPPCSAHASRLGDAFSLSDICLRTMSSLDITPVRRSDSLTTSSRTRDVRLSRTSRSTPRACQVARGRLAISRRPCHARPSRCPP